MAEPLAPLNELGRVVARVQDEQLDGIELSTQERLLDRPLAAPRRRRGRWAALSLAAAALIGLAVVLLRPQPLTFTVGETAASAEIDQFIAAPPDASLPLRFSDGTSLVLGPMSRTRVTATSEDGAEVVVERGRVEAFVVPRASSRWRLRFGPFQVLVTGTRFTADWNPTTEQLSVVLHEGSVMVRGTALGEGHPLAAGNRLDVSARRKQFTITSTSPPPPTTPSADPAVDPRSAAAEADAGTESDRDAASETTPASPALPRVPRWRQLHEAGQYTEALREAKAQGFEGLCAKAGAAELLLLADVALTGGDSSLAEGALTTLRRRHPGGPQAAHAAFILGTLAYDQRGAYGQAAQWFTVYLTEQPGGNMAHEATVRLLEASSRAGDTAGAQAAAKRYLATYPNGPHAEQARRVAAPEPSADR